MILSLFGTRLHMTPSHDSNRPDRAVLLDALMVHILLPMRVCLALTTLLVVLAACAPPVSEGGFDAPDPASKMYAIEDAVRRNDCTELASIVEQLDSDDPAVRLVAISALERMTGETHGYLHYATREEREQAVRRWVEECQRRETAAGESGIMPTTRTEDSPQHDG